MNTLTPRQIAYEAFLRTPFWKALSRACIERDLFRCTKCSFGKLLQAHHVTYPADWNQTTLEHLVTLCGRCHRQAHGIPEPPRKKREKRKRRHGWRPSGGNKPRNEKEWKQRRKYAPAWAAKVASHQWTPSIHY